MKFNFNSVFLAAFLGLGAHAAVIQEAAPEKVIPNQYIVSFKGEKDVSKKVKRYLKGNGSNWTRNLRGERILDVQAADVLASQYNGVVSSYYANAFDAGGMTVQMDKADAEELAKDPTVAQIEEDQVVEIDQVTWGIDRVDDEDLPLDNSYSPTGTGDGVYAYVIDTGVRITHNEFEGRAEWGTNTVGDGQNTDCHGHGTHVAGSVGGKDYGVAKDVNIVAVKVLSCSGSGSWSGVIQGCEWVISDATSKNRKATANMSLGGGFSSQVNNAVKNMQAAGVVTVVAAGNSNANACNYSPASEGTVTTVGATTNQDARSSFSNYGTCVDIFAPGSSITGPWKNSDSELKTISGTSMASPHVCGGAAILLGQGVAPEDVATELDNNAVENTINNVGSGSPNKFLYVGTTGPTNPPAPTAPPTPTPAPTECTQSSIVIEVKTDNYPAETEWTLENKCSDSDFEEKRGAYENANEVHEHIYCVPNGQYSFTIKDTYGDGMCCSYGDGYYRVVHNGKLVASGGRYEAQEVHLFDTCDDFQPPTSPTEPPLPPTTPPTSVTPAPTKSPSAAPSIGGPTRCEDDPLGWHDVNGTIYDCAWYGQELVGEIRCERDGGTNPNDGKTAQEACCVCGGGKQVPDEGCEDKDGWFDVDGPHYDCAWYGQGTRCIEYGDLYEREYSANDACCACGGGDSN